MGLLDYVMEKVRGRKADIKLPNEKPYSKQRQQAYDKEKSDDAVRRFQSAGKKIQGLFPNKK